MSETKDLLSKLETNVKVNSLNAWILAARPKTLTGASVPIMIGIAFAFIDIGWERFKIIPAVLCVFFAFIMQIDANFVNDYFDCLKGNDDSETRLGPKRACSEGWITLRAMRRGLFLTTILACIVGLPLIYYGGWRMIVVGMFCVAFCFLYTTKLSYLGLGDLLVLIFFGIVPVCMTYYVILPKVAQTVTWQVFIASIACGLIIDTLLVVNNYRDRTNDKQANKYTLVVRIGEKRTEKLYLWLGIMGVCLMAIVFTFTNGTMNILSNAVLLLYLLFHIRTWNEMKRIKVGKELNNVLGQTARNMFVYGLLATIGILLIKL